MRHLIPIFVFLLAGSLFGSELVTKVSDGDTIWTQNENGERTKIRMVKIDAPESNQPFGPESTKHLTDLIKGKMVEVKSYGVDMYGRGLLGFDQHQPQDG